LFHVKLKVSRETIGLAQSFVVKPIKHSMSCPSPEVIGEQVHVQVARWLAVTPFSPQEGFLDRIKRMAAALALWGSRTNLTASPDDPGEIAFHIIDSLAPIALAPDENRCAIESSFAAGASVLDVGSGAGFPGLVLAAAFDAHFTLVESRRKRASYLQLASREMGLRNVTVEQRRVDPQSIQAEFDLATGRAFGALSDLYPIAAAALRPNGHVLLYASAGQNLEADAARRAGLVGPARWEYSVARGERSAMRMAALWRIAPKLNSPQI
jgi:16S rRNA (guanine527-N7)-methyltransferase